MRHYALRRALLIFPTVWAISLLAFGVAHLAAGDPAADAFRRSEGRSPNSVELVALRKELGLDRPLPAQYLRWIAKAGRGDLGTSLSGRPVSTELRLRIPPTLKLTAVAALLAVALAVPAGVVAAQRHNRMADHVLRLAALAGTSVPSFWLAFLLVEVFAVRLSLLPVAGRQGAASVVLPAITLAVGPAAVLARFTRAAVLERVGEDYVRTAQAKGLRQWEVLTRHALRTALVPLVTAMGTSVGQLAAGTVIVETVFVWPGMGRLALDAILQRDYPVIQGFVLYAGLTFAVLNLLVDLSYAGLDPRVRVGGRR